MPDEFTNKRNYGWRNSSTDALEALKKAVDARYAYLLIMKGEGESIRRDLGIMDSHYDEIWGDLLEILTETVCDSYLNERQLEDGFRSFTMLMNTLRTHRSL